MERGLISKDLNGEVVFKINPNGKMFFNGRNNISNITNLILNNEELVELLNEGSILDTYTNEHQVVFQVQIHLDIDVEKFLMTSVVDKIAELAFKNNLKLNVAQLYNTPHKDHVGYELKFSLNS